MTEMTHAFGKESIFRAEFSQLLERASAEERQIRESAFARFAALGIPTPANEEWKYTSLASVSFADYRIRTSDVIEIKAPAGVHVSTGDAYEIATFDSGRTGLTALNAAFANVVTITIPKETSVSEPIEFRFSGETGTIACPHVVVRIGAGAKATIIETYESQDDSVTNSAVQIFAEENASLTHYRVQKESNAAVHIGTTEITLAAGSRYDSTNINLGARISRHDVHLKFTAEGAEAFVDGLYVLQGDQHHDTHSSIDHAVPNCVSHQSYKGVLNDKSRGVFNGKVFVRENASGTDAQQSNKNLLLSNDARVDTKPQLEIFNDDVKCAHGATVGQLEDEELFYLLSRGLNENLARNLLTYGFAEEIVNKIDVESVKSEIDAAVLNRIHTDFEA